MVSVSQISSSSTRLTTDSWVTFAFLLKHWMTECRRNLLVSVVPNPKTLTSTRWRAPPILRCLTTCNHVQIQDPGPLWIRYGRTRTRWALLNHRWTSMMAAHSTDQIGTTPRINASRVAILTWISNSECWQTVVPDRNNKAILLSSKSTQRVIHTTTTSRHRASSRVSSIRT